jgi:hypothetical protein
LIINDKCQPNIIKDDLGTKFDSSSQTHHDNPDDSGDANDFLNKLSSEFESHETALLSNVNDDIGITSDSLLAFDKNKSDGW